MEKNLGVFGLVTDNYRSCITTEIRVHCQMTALKILRLKRNNFAFKIRRKLDSNWRKMMLLFGIAEYPQIFPHGGSAVYVGGIESVGSPIYIYDRYAVLTRVTKSPL